MLAYRHESYIADAIEGVLEQQTNFPYELVIGEDGSTDATLDICRKYERAHPDIIRVISTGQNVSHGSNGNLKRTCRALRGKYVAFCEGDDYWIDPLKLQKQVDYMDAHPECTICFHPVRVHWEDGREPDSVYPADFKEFLHRESACQALAKHNFIQTNSVMYRWNADGKLFDDFPIFELPADWLLNLYHARLGRIGFLPDIMAVYRRRPDGLWTDALSSGEWFKRCGYRNALFYLWVQREFGLNMHGILRRLVLATLAQVPPGQKEQAGKLLEIMRPSPFWARISGLMAFFYGVVARLAPGAIRKKAKRLQATWAVIYRGRDSVLSSLSRQSR